MKKNIVLIGMPGCGKTTIGRIISRELKIKFYDMDEYIEITTGKKISELFEKGEAYFREIETKVCKELALKNNAIISTGGGVVKNKENINYLKQNGIVIFVDRPVDNIISDVDTSKRPLLKDGKDKILNLYDERYELYRESADEIIINNRDVKCVKNKIIEIYREINNCKG